MIRDGFTLRKQEWKPQNQPARGVSVHPNAPAEVDEIAATIDATISGILADDTRTVREFMSHLELSQAGSFLVSDVPLPDRILHIAAVSLWLGFEAGNTDTMGRDMEALFLRGAAE
jgi:hypothetical protein